MPTLPSHGLARLRSHNTPYTPCNELSTLRQFTNPPVSREDESGSTLINDCILVYFNCFGFVEYPGEE